MRGQRRTGESVHVGPVQPYRTASASNAGAYRVGKIRVQSSDAPSISQSVCRWLFFVGLLRGPPDTDRTTSGSQEGSSRSQMGRANEVAPEKPHLGETRIKMHTTDREPPWRACNPRAGCKRQRSKSQRADLRSQISAAQTAWSKD